MLVRTALSPQITLYEVCYMKAMSPLCIQFFANVENENRDPIPRAIMQFDLQSRSAGRLRKEERSDI